MARAYPASLYGPSTKTPKISKHLKGSLPLKPSNYLPKKPKCNNFDFGSGNAPRTPIDKHYATEHILELQMVPIFLDKMNTEFGNTFPNYQPGADPNTRQDLCTTIKQLWQGVRQDNRFAIDGVTRNPVDFIMLVCPSGDNTDPINNDGKMNSCLQVESDRAVKNLKDVMTAMKYLQDTTINTQLKTEKERVAARLKELDEVQMPKWVKKTANKDWSKWKSRGLEGKWNSFMKRRATTAKDKAVKYIDDDLKTMKDNYATAFNKEQAKGSGPENEALKKLIENIEKLEIEWTRYEPVSWGNPF